MEETDHETRAMGYDRDGGGRARDRSVSRARSGHGRPRGATWRRSASRWAAWRWRRAGNDSDDLRVRRWRTDPGQVHSGRCPGVASADLEQRAPEHGWVRAAHA